jgi:DNA-binding transcriptional LysR family regulator
LRLLEEHLGAELFSRGPKGMAATSAGELLLGFADEQLTTAERLHAKLGSGRHKTSGQVTVATVEAPLSSFIPQALAEVAATHPDIVVNVLAAGSNDVAALVAENRADLGLVFGPVPRSDVTELVTRPSPLFVMVAPDHPLSARPRCDLTDLLGVRLALPDKSFGIRQEVERAAAEHRARPELDAGLLTAVAVDDRRLTSTRITLISRLTASGSPALTVVGDALAVAMHGSPRDRDPARVLQPADRHRWALSSCVRLCAELADACARGVPGEPHGRAGIRTSRVPVAGPPPPR